MQMKKLKRKIYIKFWPVKDLSWSIVENYFSLLFFCSARRDKPEQCVGFIEGLMPMFSLTSVTVLYFTFGYFSRSDLLNTNLRLYCITYGLIYSNLNVSVIAARYGCMVFTLFFLKFRGGGGLWNIFHQVCGKQFFWGNSVI